MALVERNFGQEKPNQSELIVTGSCSYRDWVKSVVKLVDPSRVNREVTLAELKIRGEFFKHKLARHDTFGEVNAVLVF